MRTDVGLIVAFIASLSCARVTHDPANTALNPTNLAETVSVRNALLAVTDTLAAAISRRDGATAGRCAGRDSSVAYVTDGNVLRCGVLSTVLAQFYAPLRSLDLRWEQREIQVIDHDAGVVIGWAAIDVVDSSGTASHNRSIFTLIYSRKAGQGGLVTAHKTTLPD